MAAHVEGSMRFVDDDFDDDEDNDDDADDDKTVDLAEGIHISVEDEDDEEEREVFGQETIAAPDKPISSLREVKFPSAINAKEPSMSLIDAMAKSVQVIVDDEAIESFGMTSIDGTVKSKQPSPSRAPDFVKESTSFSEEVAFGIAYKPYKQVKISQETSLKVVDEFEIEFSTVSGVSGEIDDDEFDIDTSTTDVNAVRIALDRATRYSSLSHRCSPLVSYFCCLTELQRKRLCSLLTNPLTLTKGAMLLISM